MDETKDIFANLEFRATDLQAVTGVSDERKSEEHQTTERQSTTEEHQNIASIVKQCKYVSDCLSRQVLGQEYAVNEVVSGIFRSEMRLITEKNRKNPRGFFLFLGPPGVGKTFMARQIAATLNIPFQKFDMSSYSGTEGVGLFAGVPKTYSGSKAGEVTAFVKENPVSLLVFDEIEKAHREVIQLFLQILDGGSLEDARTNEQIDFKDTIIIFTSNAGRSLYENSETAFLSGISKKVILEAIESEKTVGGTVLFPSEICSRFSLGNIILFNHLDIPFLYEIVKREIQTKANQMEETIGVKIQFEETIYTALLMETGGHCDARTISSRANLFFYEELFELLRLVDSERCKSDIQQIKTIHFRMQWEDKKEIREYFTKDKNSQALVFADDGMFPFLEEAHTDWYFVHSCEELDEYMKKEEVDMFWCDIRKDSEETAEYLNIEDQKSRGRNMFRYVREKYPSLPVYIIDTGEIPIRSEEKLSFLKKGARDVIYVEGKQREVLKDYIAQVNADLHRQKGIKMLASSNKVLRFETAQKISEDGLEAEVVLFDFDLRTAASAKDTKSILGDLSRPHTKFTDIIGAKDAKEELEYFVKFLKNPRKYHRNGMRPPRGALLYGPPGTGKTMLAKAMAGESNVTFISAQGNQFLKKWVGEAPESVHRLFQTARKYAPTILFVDEVDVIAQNRRYQNSSHGVTEEVLTAFLTEMDGFETDSSKPVFVLAATNYEMDGNSRMSLDEAFIRRFDRKIRVDLPLREDRKIYLHQCNKKYEMLNLSENGIENIALRATGMSLADIENIMELSIRLACRQEAEWVTDEILDDAFETYRSGEKKVWEKEELLRTARHEAGHALMCCLCGEIPAYVSIVARGNYGGYVQHGDSEQKGSYVKQELLDRIRISLAGRAAEILYYGAEQGLSTGAAGDLQQATEIAESILCDYGMDEAFGLSYRKRTGEDKGTSGEAYAKTNAILKKELENAIAKLDDNREILERIAEALMEDNYLRKDSLSKILSDGEETWDKKEGNAQ